MEQDFCFDAELDLAQSVEHSCESIHASRAARWSVGTVADIAAESSESAQKVAEPQPPVRDCYKVWFRFRNAHRFSAGAQRRTAKKRSSISRLTGVAVRHERRKQSRLGRGLGFGSGSFRSGCLFSFAGRPLPCRPASLQQPAHALQDCGCAWFILS